MNKADPNQSMEDAIAEALAAVDSLGDEGAPENGQTESVVDAEEPESPDDGGEEVSLDADLDAAVAMAIEAVAEPETAEEPQAEPEKGTSKSEAKEGAEKALDELKTRHMRLMADFDNYRKRVQREQATQRLYASENVMHDLLSVVDNIERAISATNDEGGAGSLREGINMILNQMLSSMERHGVKPFESVGTSFDPERHEAVARQGHPEHEEDIVCEEMQKGYMLHDRLLRPASVIVSAGKLDMTDDSASNAGEGPEAKS